MLTVGIQPYNSSVAFTSTGRDSVSYSSGSIKFADGRTQSINSGSFSGLATGVNYIYFTYGSSSLSVTTDYSNTIGNTKGLLAMVGVPSTGSYCWIQPFYSKGLNIIADVIASNAILSRHITASEDIVGKRFATAENLGQAGSPSGIKFDSNGIIGYTGGATVGFKIGSDGKGYCAGNKVILDSDFLTCKGTALLFKTETGSNRGDINAQTDGLVVESISGHLFLSAPIGYNIRVYRDLIPSGALNIGSTSDKFQSLYLSGNANIGASVLAPNATFNNGTVSIKPIGADHPLIFTNYSTDPCLRSDAADWGMLGTSTYNLYSIYSRYVYYKYLSTFSHLDDLSVLKSFKEVEIEDDRKGKKVKVYDMSSVHPELKDESGNFFNAGATVGFLLGVAKQLTDKIEQLESLLFKQQKEIGELKKKVAGGME